MKRRILLAVGLVAGLVTAGTCAGSTASAAPSPIDGEGSSWAAPAIDQWARDEQDHGLTVDYNGDGSAVGRSSFQQYQDDFAVSDLAYEPTESQSRPYAYLPVTAGAVAFPYQVRVGGTLKRNVRLSGTTLADIFRGAITNWNDAEITADNNGHRVAANLPIIPVVRSDASATSYHLTDWFSIRFPRRWRAFDDEGATEFFPTTTDGREIMKSGASQVEQYVTASSANGAIGYVENAYVEQDDAPAIDVRNAAGFFVPPAAANASLSLLRATQTSSGEGDLRGLYDDPDRRAYPLAYYSYGIIPTAANDPRMTTAKRQAEVDFFGYTLCGGQGEADQLGYAALPLNLTRAGLRAVALLHKADPNVDTAALSLARCANPTIAHHDDGTVSDDLAASVAQPPACAASGAGPCKQP